tara:strand:- start:1199 stop:1345 length:147 start_codon:yes stop_codon:yes gene_type:complete
MTNDSRVADLTPVQAFELALELAITAPNEAQARQALMVAERIAKELVQ